MADLDGDGRVDVISGSWPGRLYLFRQTTGGAFAAGEVLTDQDGKPVDIGSGTAPFAADWDGDGKLDLIVGTAAGEVFFLPNVGTRDRPAFGAPRVVMADGKPIQVRHGDAAPAVADWDGDGRPDLLLGDGDGQVVWFRNEGTAKEPKLAAARVLVPPSPSGWRDDKARRPGEWGVRVKPCVVDWDGDGRPDLLLGDRCGGCEAKPVLTPGEAIEEQESLDRLPGLRKEWAAAYKQYAAAADAPEPADPAARDAHRRRVADLRTRMTRLKEELTRYQDLRDRYKTGYMSHGYVWFFRRLPAGP